MNFWGGELEKEKFYFVVRKLILPLLTGSQLVGEEESNAREAEVALGKQNSLLIKPSKSAEYRLVIKRGRAYQPFEINLLKNILIEINAVSSFEGLDPSYEMGLLEKAIEKAVCDSAALSASPTMLGLVSELSSWSARTYEGKKVNFGIILNISDNSEAGPLHYSDMLTSDFFALLSDGKNSFVEFNKDGYLTGYVSLSKVRNYSSIAPYEFNYVARYCGEKKVGIALTENGDLLIFKNHMLMYAKRRGKWTVYSHEEIIQLLSYRSVHSLKEIRRAIYLSAVDCSFNYSGGIIVYLKRDAAEGALIHVDARDILDNKYYEIKKNIELAESEKLYNITSAEQTRKFYSLDYENFLKKNSCYKAECLKQIINGRKFHELDRKLREEIIAMDGATIIDFDGTIIAAGAILKIEAGSLGGGRLAAAKDLSKYGVSMKISQDGVIQGFSYDKKNAIKVLFTVS